MYYRHKQWLEQASIDSKILKLLHKRKEIKQTLIYLKYEHDRALEVLGIVANNYYKAAQEYKDLDLELAFMDGRYSVVEIPKTKKKKKKKVNIKEQVKSMSKDQINSLIDELLKMKGK